MPSQAFIFMIHKYSDSSDPSNRRLGGELEITDVNNAYIKAGMLTWDLLQGWWTDAGTIESLYLANQLVGQTGANNLSLAA